MALPFTVEQFFGVFARYNEAVWPAPLLLYALAAAALVAIAAGRPGSGRFVTVALAVLWAWSGVVYHWVYFSAVNPAAWLFGALFLGQAVLFVREGVLRHRLVFAVHDGSVSIVALALVAFALLGYPILGAALGHSYPAAPTFGAPCPTTILTLGLLLLARGTARWPLFAIPLLWAVVSGAAAFSLGVYEDLGLVAAAGFAAAVLVRDRIRRRHAEAPRAAGRRPDRTRAVPTSPRPTPRPHVQLR
jgi:hypothetical protein